MKKVLLVLVLLLTVIGCSTEVTDVLSYTEGIQGKANTEVVFSYVDRKGYVELLYCKFPSDFTLEVVYTLEGEWVTKEHAKRLLNENLYPEVLRMYRKSSNSTKIRLNDGRLFEREYIFPKRVYRAMFQPNRCRIKS